MKLLKLTFFTLFLIFFSNKTLFSEIPHFVDFKMILNNSDAGKKAQTYLKNKLEKGIKNIQSKEKKKTKKKKKKLYNKRRLYLLKNIRRKSQS